MAETTGIEWTGSTWTPIRAKHRASGKLGWHCVHVSPGCKHCYAETMNGRLGTGLPFKPGHAADVEIILDETMLLAPLRWKKPRPIFVCSMTDLFADFVPTEMIDRVFAVMALCPQHTFQVLTKRPDRMRAYIEPAFDRIVVAMMQLVSEGWPCVRHKCEALGIPYRKPTSAHDWYPLRNVWLGVSAEDQRRADERVPDLLATPAAIRFVSAEPMLGPIDFTKLNLLRYFKVENTLDPNWPRNTFDALRGRSDIHPIHNAEPEWAKLDWIIAGGESGPAARPMHPDWARSIRNQCAAAGTAFFFKQWGEWGSAGTFHTATTHRICPGALIWDAIPHRVLAVERDEAGMASGTTLCRLGKKAAGRELDGVEHSAMPSVRP